MGLFWGKLAAVIFSFLAFVKEKAGNVCDWAQKE